MRSSFLTGLATLGLASAASEFKLLSGICRPLPSSFNTGNGQAMVGDVNLRPVGTGLYIDDLTGNGWGSILESRPYTNPWSTFALQNQTDMARDRVQCIDDIGLSIPGNPSKPLRINTDLDGTLVFDSYGFIPEPYAYYVDGQRQPGVYLGGAGETRWAWSQVEKSGIVYWKPRLLVATEGRPGGSDLKEGEVEGFLVAKPY